MSNMKITSAHKGDSINENTLTGDSVAQKKEAFHDKHEQFTEKAYNATNLLPDRYVLVLTNLCNLRCCFCFQKKNPRNDAMRLTDWKRLVDQIPDYARVTLCGGEPLLFSGFREIFSYIAERVDCNIISNGILLNEETIDYLLSFPNFKVLSLSIDNIGNTLRDVTFSQWEHLKKMLKYFLEKRSNLHSDCILDIKTMILDENADELFEIYKYFVEEIGVDTHAFQFLKGSPIQHADYMYELKNISEKSEAQVYKKFDLIKEQLDRVRSYNVQRRKFSFLHPKLDSLVLDRPLSNIDCLNNPYYIKEIYSPCKFPWSSVHINFDGNLFPCLAVSMGNVKEECLSAIINGDEFKKFKDLIRQEGTVDACNRCGWLRPKDKVMA
ncbi:MAG: radical SAM protein [Candidatus Scalindua sp.]|nr:radical SAM protein [Candidatus Scalindua sp.]MBT6051007.1 radical SAM protein [Candidatus Scalindua sp.]